jgi:DNA repair protein RadC
MRTLLALPPQERPRERLWRLGPEALSDTELLALLLGTGSAKSNALELAEQILLQVGGAERLIGLEPAELRSLSGIGPGKAARLCGALMLVLRGLENRSRLARKGRFHCSRDIFEHFRNRLALLKHEVFYAVGLSSRNEVLRELLVAKGTTNECRVDPQEVFRPLVSEGAPRAVLVHNHPSGDPTPSPSDVALTRRLMEGGRILGISILDHVIVGREEFASLRDLGMMSAS